MGRPEILAERPLTDYGEDDDEARYSTVAYAWDMLGVYTGTSKALYKVFTNELDALTAFHNQQVEESVDHRLGRDTRPIHTGIERVGNSQDAERKVINWDDYEDHMQWFGDDIKHRLCA
ncbi:Serine/threonine-protein phosphatase 7 long form-like protein [Hordeum vulgare]|nr:Serine/threonine-protein phosphatase 7 long form-like protein [Hordeum vulgare]